MNALEHGDWKAKPNPREWHRPVMRAALGLHDVSKVYRLLQRTGFSQGHIGFLTEQSQPEVSALVNGRRLVSRYDVLKRIFDGLGVPRGLVGMSSSCCPYQCMPAVGEILPARPRHTCACGNYLMPVRPLVSA